MNVCMCVYALACLCLRASVYECVFACMRLIVRETLLQYACLRVSFCACVCLCVHVCMCVGVRVRARSRVCVCLHLYIDVCFVIKHACLHVIVRVYILLYTCMYACVFT